MLAFVNNFDIKSFAGKEIVFQIVSSNSNFPILIFDKISSSEFPSKGGYPAKSIKRSTPVLHRSHFSSYSPDITSGAM